MLLLDLEFGQQIDYMNTFKKVLLKAGFKKDGYIKNRRLNKDGTYSGVEYYSKTKE